MTARARVLAAYGHRCAWCGRTDLPLQIDHIVGGEGQGNGHRKERNRMLDCRLVNGYIRAVQRPTACTHLCAAREHHNRHRKPAMPEGKHKTSITISLPDDIVKHVGTIAAKPGVTRAHVVLQ